MDSCSSKLEVLEENEYRTKKAHSAASTFFFKEILRSFKEKAQYLLIN